MPPVTQQQQEEDLRQALLQLPVDEILALAYRFRHSTRRLRLYLEVCRTKSTMKAALAASMICFDLARQGSEAAQREFEALSVTLKDFDLRSKAAAELIEGSDYLGDLWPDCERAIAAMDPRTSAAESLEVNDSDIVELDILDDEDLQGFDEILVDTPDNEALRRRFEKALDDFFGTGPDRQRGEKRGFFAVGRSEIERLETFIRELDSVNGFIPDVTGLQALAELFLATHLRSRTFWGKPNKKRIELTRAGLRHFAQANATIFRAAAFFDGFDSESHAWMKILQLLLDFFKWRRQHADSLPMRQAIDAYADLAVQLPPLSFDDRRTGER